LLTAHPELPAPSDAARAHSVALAQTIREEIDRSGGWIDFARYMTLALYAPGLGYYAAGSHKLGEAGDFVTAPELSPLFSTTLARQMAEVLQSTGGDILELGAGTGRMAADILVALDELGDLPQRYRILEVSSDLRARQRTYLTALPARLAARVEWLDALPDDLRGVVVANEVLDALPVHLIAWRQNGVFERGVSHGEAGFVYADRPLESAALRARVERLDLAAPYVSEVSMAAPALVHDLAQRLRHGVLLLIDYGFGSSEYYHLQRRTGTLMCHYRHRAHDDPFFLPGLQDITAHVDFTAVAEAGVAGGAALLGYTNQAGFLINRGITDLLARRAQADRYYVQVANVQKLLSPAEMGELFKVLALGRGIDRLAGFSRGDLSRLL